MQESISRTTRINAMQDKCNSSQRDGMQDKTDARCAAHLSPTRCLAFHFVVFAFHFVVFAFHFVVFAFHLSFIAFLWLVISTLTFLVALVYS